MKKLLLALLVLGILTSTAQSKLSKKEMTKRLTANSWKVVKTWNGNQDEDNKPMEWIESPLGNSRLSEYFGVDNFTLKPNGTFTAIGFTGSVFSGQWNFKRALAITYKDPDGYEYRVQFENIQFTANGLISTGDICYDGCFVKVEFEKVKV